jgi:hypothetical protein
MDLEDQGNLIARLKEHGLQVPHQRLAIYQRPISVRPVAVTV